MGTDLQDQRRRRQHQHQAAQRSARGEHAGHTQGEHTEAGNHDGVLADARGPVEHRRHEEDQSCSQVRGRVGVRHPKRLEEAQEADPRQPTEGEEATELGRPDDQVDDPGHVPEGLGLVGPGELRAVDAPPALLVHVQVEGLTGAVIRGGVGAAVVDVLADPEADEHEQQLQDQGQHQQLLQLGVLPAHHHADGNRHQQETGQHQHRYPHAARRAGGKRPEPGDAPPPIATPARTTRRASPGADQAEAPPGHRLGPPPTSILPCSLVTRRPRVRPHATGPRPAARITLTDRSTFRPGPPGPALPSDIPDPHTRSNEPRRVRRRRQGRLT
jgi:hypothetical protein